MKAAYYGFEKSNFCRGVVCSHLSDLVTFTIDLTTKDIFMRSKNVQKVLTDYCIHLLSRQLIVHLPKFKI